MPIAPDAAFSVSVPVVVMLSADSVPACSTMLPVVAGRDETRRQILIYSLVLVPLALAPWLIGFSGWMYGVGVGLLGARFLQLAYAVWRRGDDTSARRLFGFSILYLFLIFVLLLADHWARALGWFGV